jgi:hypothetical protein
MHQRPVIVEPCPSPAAARARCAFLRQRGYHAWVSAVGDYRTYAEKCAAPHRVIYYAAVPAQP